MSFTTISRSPDEQIPSPNYIARSEVNERENNEDSFLILSLFTGAEQPPLHLLAVADGMGGHAYGEHISREALRKISLSLFEQLSLEMALNTLQPVRPPGRERLSTALWAALQQTNHHIRRMIETNKWEKAGSTLVIAAIFDNQVVVSNLGDSPLFHYQSDTRQLTQVTHDHTIAGALLRANVITPEMAKHHEGRSRLEYFIGCDPLPREAILYHKALRPGDLLLLCSDGVSGSLSIEQIRGILADPAGNLTLMAARLLQSALAAEETDNQTLILWRHLAPSPAFIASMPTLLMTGSPRPGDTSTPPSPGNLSGGRL
jgi:serine/threonine protein phosphatase PrpC